jgi:YegS/Rv2252/BmrU family lipid kinase
VSFRTLFVVNPRSAGGKTASVWKGLEPSIKAHVPEFEARWTKETGHATELTRAGLKEGFEMIVSVGGDGTNNEVINGLFEDGKPVKPGAVFSCVPRGTGCDFARGMGIPRDPQKAFARLAGDATVPLDVGRIDYTDASNGSPRSRYFVNISGFGANGDVVARVNRSGKKLGGFLTFLTATVSSLATFDNPKVAFSCDGGPEETATLNTMFVCNGQYCGGGMKAGPDAKIDDGVLDLTVVGDMGRLEALMSGRYLYSGRIYSHPKVRHFRVKTLTARPLDGTVLVEADGEQPGILPATFTAVPGALRLKV